MNIDQMIQILRTILEWILRLEENDLRVPISLIYITCNQIEGTILVPDCRRPYTFALWTWTTTALTKFWQLFRVGDSIGGKFPVREVFRSVNWNTGVREKRRGGAE